MIQNLINHIVLVVDKSGSMSALSSQVVKVFDSQIEYLARRSKEMNQETRVSVYLFDTRVECLIYDMDVMRLPSLAGYYRANGGTALIAGTLKAIEDLKKTPELYGDHAFLTYVLTDGQETENRSGGGSLKRVIESLPENWTVAAMVPNQTCVFEAKGCGFPAANIQVWDTTSKGLSDAGEAMRNATEGFFVGRSKGIRSTKNLFSMDTSSLSRSAVRSSLIELPATDYKLFPVHKDAVIQPFVESWTQKPYRLGGSYYMLSKPEKVQGHKQVCVQEKLTGKVYGGSNARNLLGLPNHEVKVEPASHPNYDIFVQSTSVNRKLVAGTKLLVMN